MSTQSDANLVSINGAHDAVDDQSTVTEKCIPTICLDAQQVDSDSSCDHGAGCSEFECHSTTTAKEHYYFGMAKFLCWLSSLGPHSKFIVTTVLQSQLTPGYRRALASMNDPSDSPTDTKQSCLLTSDHDNEDIVPKSTDISYLQSLESITCPNIELINHVIRLWHCFADKHGSEPEQHLSPPPPSEPDQPNVTYELDEPISLTKDYSNVQKEQEEQVTAKVITTLPASLQTGQIKSAYNKLVVELLGMPFWLSVGDPPLLKTASSTTNDACLKESLSRHPIGQLVLTMFSHHHLFTLDDQSWMLSALDAKRNSIATLATSSPKDQQTHDNDSLHVKCLDIILQLMADFTYVFQAFTNANSDSFVPSLSHSLTSSGFLSGSAGSGSQYDLLLDQSHHHHHHSNNQQSHYGTLLTVPSTSELRQWHSDLTASCCSSTSSSSTAPRRSSDQPRRSLGQSSRRNGSRQSGRSSLPNTSTACITGNNLVDPIAEHVGDSPAAVSEEDNCSSSAFSSSPDLLLEKADHQSSSSPLHANHLQTTDPRAPKILLSAPPPPTIVDHTSKSSMDDQHLIYYQGHHHQDTGHDQWLMHHHHHPSLNEPLLLDDHHYCNDANFYFPRPASSLVNDHHHYQDVTLDDGYPQHRFLKPPVGGGRLGDCQATMSTVLCWLKGLRLHKYAFLFETLTYDEMINLNEDWLKRMNVTQGARNKILLNISKLGQRSASLGHAEACCLQTGYSSGAMRHCLTELWHILHSPMQPCFDEANNGHSLSNSPTDQQRSPLIDESPTNSLADQVIHCLARICSHLLVSPQSDLECSSKLAQLLFIITKHPAFDRRHKKLAHAWSQRIDFLLCRYDMDNSRGLPIPPAYRLMSIGSTDRLHHRSSSWYNNKRHSRPSIQAINTLSSRYDSLPVNRCLPSTTSVGSIDDRGCRRHSVPVNNDYNYSVPPLLSLGGKQRRMPSPNPLVLRTDGSAAIGGSIAPRHRLPNPPIALTAPPTRMPSPAAAADSGRRQQPPSNWWFGHKPSHLMQPQLGSVGSLFAANNSTGQSSPRGGDERHLSPAGVGASSSRLTPPAYCFGYRHHNDLDHSSSSIPSYSPPFPTTTNRQFSSSDLVGGDDELNSPYYHLAPPPDWTPHPQNRRQANHHQQPRTANNSSSAGPAATDAIEHNLDQLTRKVTELAIGQDSDVSGNE